MEERNDGAAVQTVAGAHPTCDEISDAEEAAIQAEISADPDNPELTDEEIEQLRPAADVLSPELYVKLVRSSRS